MLNINHKHALYIFSLFLLFSVAGLWSWNTISELFSLPQAQYKHVLAAFLLLLIVKWGLTPGRHFYKRISAGHREYPDH
jgi:uncharacterized membrane protein (DUF373 family)